MEATIIHSPSSIATSPQSANQEVILKANTSVKTFFIYRFTKNEQDDGFYNPNQSYVTIDLDSLYLISPEKSHLYFQAYRDGVAVNFTLIATTDGGETVAQTFLSERRVWKEYNLNIISFYNLL